jgi:hypothetical protein
MKNLVKEVKVGLNFGDKIYFTVRRGFANHALNLLRINLSFKAVRLFFSSC